MFRFRLAKMGSASKQTKLVGRSISSNLTAAAPSSTNIESPLPSKKSSADTLRPAATTDSCSLGNDNSDASDCESDCLSESSADGASEDEILKRSDVLTMDEVIQRRAKNVRKLIRLYRRQYWSLVEEMRTKYRRFYLRHGTSGWRDDAEPAEWEGEAEPAGNKNSDDMGDGMREPQERGNAEILHCGAQGCTTKPLPLSVFCFAHILMDPRQRLYKPCSYVSRTGQNGPVTCGRPVLQTVVPPLCGQHFQQAQRHVNRSLKKTLPGGAKANPKFHLIIAQYVRVIQNKRRSYEKRSALAAQPENDGKDLLAEETRFTVEPSLSGDAGGESL